MLLRRCAWHKQYRGYGRVLGISSWRGWGMTFSDGMCADCAARTRVAWQLPPAATPPRPRAGVPWATAAVTLATAAVVFGIFVGPIERAVSPAPGPATNVVAEATTAVTAPTAAQQSSPVSRPSQHVAAAIRDTTPGFGPNDKRAWTGTGSAARGRVARARGRVTAAPAGFPALEPEPLALAVMAEIDAEWSPALAAASGPAEETVAALPQAVATPPVDVQAP